MSNLKAQLQATVSYLKQIVSFPPELLIVLGTGLGGLVEMVKIDHVINYQDIPNFPVSTVESHLGQLIFGSLRDKKVCLMAGRFHYYEGYSMSEVTYGIRTLHQMGVRKLIISNAAGGLNPSFVAGDIVFIRDHINLFPENPLRGPNDPTMGVRFPDMLDTYNSNWLQIAENQSAADRLPFKTGVYLGLQGPNLETPAEYKFFHTIGADLVGMSTVPEAIVAKYLEMQLMAVSVVSNQCYPIEGLTKTTVEEVISTVQSASPKLIDLISDILPQL